MKKYYLLFFVLKLFCFNLQAQDSIPGVIQQPQWFIPIYFEDGNGDKDTVYLGYDEDATIFYDSLYESIEWIDTSEFSVNFGIKTNTDSAFNIYMMDGK